MATEEQNAFYQAQIVEPLAYEEVPVEQEPPVQAEEQEDQLPLKESLTVTEQLVEAMEKALEKSDEIQEPAAVEEPAQ